MKTRDMIPDVVAISIEAGQEILTIYESDFSVETKDDRSPLTEADKRSHQVIQRGLEKMDVPILSEEGKSRPYDERKSWDRLWIVDPLDGTKEFIKRNGEFTVNIALVTDGRPEMGVIYVPVLDVLYFGSLEMGAWRVQSAGKKPFSSLDALLSSASRLPLPPEPQRPYTIVGSRSHGTPELEAFVAEKKESYPDLQFVSAGSSLKFCLVAEGRAEVYPRLGPTMEWDTAAGQAIVESAGGRVVVADTGKPLTYNREELLNPSFIVWRE